MVQGILDNAEDADPEEIAGPDIYPDIPLDVVRRMLRFAYQSEITAIIGPAEPPAPPLSAEAQARLDTLRRARCWPCDRSRSHDLALPRFRGVRQRPARLSD